ncbi:MAG: hypothetical protein QQN63_12075 [Nitrosopumilus sp.]
MMEIMMGLYINPPRGSKENFLQRYATEITIEEAKAWPFTNPDFILLVYVIPGPFAAVGIAYNTIERDVFTQHYPRLRKFYTTHRENIVFSKTGVSPGELLKREGW